MIFIYYKILLNKSRYTEVTKDGWFHIKARFQDQLSKKFYKSEFSWKFNESKNDFN